MSVSHTSRVEGSAGECGEPVGETDEPPAVAWLLPPSDAVERGVGDDDVDSS